MNTKNGFTIRGLNIEDVLWISTFLFTQPPQYLRFFYAFGADEKEISKMLENAVKDVYMGVFWQDKLIGIFMLRGWDEGYEIPTFGVLIDYKFRGKSLLHLTLDTAKMICRLSGTKTMIAKVHPQNGSQRSMNRLGFSQKGIEERTGNIIYQMEL